MILRHEGKLGSPGSGGEARSLCLIAQYSYHEVVEPHLEKNPNPGMVDIDKNELSSRFAPIVPIVPPWFIRGGSECYEIRKLGRRCWGGGEKLCDSSLPPSSSQCQST